MTLSRSTTDKLFEAISEIIPNMPEHVISLQLDIGVDRVPKMTITTWTDDVNEPKATHKFNLVQSDD